MEAGASVVLATSFLMRSRLMWRRRCKTVAAWSGARASMWDVARLLFVPILSLDRSSGGGEALTLSASLARRGAPLAAAGDGGRLGVGDALRAAAGSCGGGWRIAGGS